MSSEEDKEYVFLCPECDESLKVNDTMKESLIERGCVICGTSVTMKAFAKNSTGGST
jgi:transcription initiation factor IIE alpha subunit